MKIGGDTMNKVYEMMKDLTVSQIREMRALAASDMPPAMARVLQGQCDYAIEKKNSGAW